MEVLSTLYSCIFLAKKRKSQPRAHQNESKYYYLSLQSLHYITSLTKRTEITNKTIFEKNVMRCRVDD